MYKKIFCLVLALVMTVCVLGQAEDNKVLFDLKSFGIIRDEVTDEEFLGNNMSRAEFVTSVLRMLRYEDILDLMQSIVRFSDVRDDAPYAKYIYAGVTIGMLNGYGDGTFRPDVPITRDEVAKVLVCVLGYANVAIQGGGYPDGYTVLAARLGVLKNVSFSSPPTRMEVYTAIYNTLDIDMMEKQLIGNLEQYIIVKEMTFRNQYKNNEFSGNVIKGKGILNADYDFYLNEPLITIKENQVQIDEKLYYIGNTSPFAFLGLEVEFYYVDNIENNTQTLVNIKPTVNNNVIELTEDEFERLEGGIVYYKSSSNDDREKSVRLAQNLKLIKNGVPQNSWADSDITVESGILKLIDNTGDGRYNLVIREEYAYVTVKEVKADRILFNENQTFDSMTQLFLELDDPDLTYVFINDKYERISYEDIEKDNTLSIMVNEHSNLYKIVVTDNIVEGTISEIYTDKETIVIIGGDEYPLYKNAWRKAKLGDTVKAWLNFKGKIIDFELIETDLQYGYVMYASALTPAEADGSVYSAVKGIDKHKVKMIIPGTLAIEYEIDETNPDNIIRTPYIKGKNSDLKEFDVADSLKKGVLMYTPIKYRLNANGEINYYEKAEAAGINGKRVYNGYDRTFGARNIGAFGTDDSTKIICVPTNAATCSDDDYHAMIDMNNNSEYTINGYDLEEDKMAKLAVIYENMELSSSRGITKNSRLSVVVSIKNIYNSETEESEVNMVFYSDGSRKTFKIADSLSNYVASNMKAGDVFYYELNALGELGVVRVIGSYQRPNMQNVGNANEEMSATSIGKVLFGRVSDVKYKDLSDPSNKYLDRVTISFGISEMPYLLETDYRNPPKVYIVNMSKKTVEIGEREDIYVPAPSSEDYIFAHITGGKVRGIVIYKY